MAKGYYKVHDLANGWAVSVLHAADAQQDGLLTDHTGGTLRNFQIVYPDGQGTDAFAAYVTGVSRASIAKNGRLTRTFTLRISGAITES